MRGVIMSVKGKKAVLLTTDGEFVKIKNKNYSIGDKVKITSSAGHVGAMAASLLIVCGGIGSYFIPAGYVSVDINPSLLLTLNIYNRVIDVKAFNDDAELLIANTDIQGKNMSDGVDMLVKTSEEMGYLNDNNNDVIFEVVDGIKKIDLSDKDYENVDVVIENADKKDLERSKQAGISIAKAKAIDEYTKLNGGNFETNAEKLNDKSVKEIRKNLDAKTEVAEVSVASDKSKPVETKIPLVIKAEKKAEKKSDSKKTSAKPSFIRGITAGKNDVIDSYDKSEDNAEVKNDVSVNDTEEKAETPVNRVPEQLFDKVIEDALPESLQDVIVTPPEKAEAEPLKEFEKNDSDSAKDNPDKGTVHQEIIPDNDDIIINNDKNDAVHRDEAPEVQKNPSKNDNQSNEQKNEQASPEREERPSQNKGNNPSDKVVDSEKSEPENRNESDNNTQNKPSVNDKPQNTTTNNPGNASDSKPSENHSAPRVERPAQSQDSRPASDDKSNPRNESRGESGNESRNDAPSGNFGERGESHSQERDRRDK